MLSKIIIIVNENGLFDSVLSDSEIEVSILQRGRNDEKIDAAETILEPIIPNVTE